MKKDSKYNFIQDTFILDTIQKVCMQHPIKTPQKPRKLSPQLNTTLARPAFAEAQKNVIAIDVLKTADSVIRLRLRLRTLYAPLTISIHVSSVNIILCDAVS